MSIYAIAPITIAVVFIIISLMNLSKISDALMKDTVSWRKILLPPVFAILLSTAATTLIHQLATGSVVIDAVWLFQQVYYYTIQPIMILAFALFFYIVLRDPRCRDLEHQ